jgi:hypothetical protein
MFPSLMVQNGVDLKTCFSHYWDEVLKMVSFGGLTASGTWISRKGSTAGLILPKRK